MGLSTATVCKPLSTTEPLVCGVEVVSGVRGTISDVMRATYAFRGGKAIPLRSTSTGRLPRLGSCGGRILIGLTPEAERLGIRTVTFSPRSIAFSVACSRDKLSIQEYAADLVEKYFNRA